MESLRSSPAVPAAADLRFRGSPPPRLPRFSQFPHLLHFPQNCNAGAANAGAFPEFTSFFRSPSGQDGDLFCFLRSLCVGFLCFTVPFFCAKPSRNMGFCCKGLLLFKALLSGIYPICPGKTVVKNSDAVSCRHFCRLFGEFRLYFVQPAHISRLDFVQFSAFLFLSHRAPEKRFLQISMRFRAAVV